jgi:PAS domain-containing protein
MPWLIPSVIATIAGTMILFLTYAYLYVQERERALLVWTIGWGIYALRFVIMLAMLLTEQHPAYLILNQSAALWSGVFILWGACLFFNRKFNPLWLLAGAAFTIWIGVSILSQFPFLWVSLPSFSFIGVVYVWTGVTILRSKKIEGLERQVAGWAFILWGIHKADYPFLRPVLWLAPWGYMLGAVLAFVVAISFLLLYFRKNKLLLQESEKRFRRLAENAVDAIILTDQHGAVRDVNPEACRSLGYSRKELLSLGAHHRPRDHT